MTLVRYGDEKIDVTTTDIPRLIAALAVAADPISPLATLEAAQRALPEFDGEREALFFAEKPLANPA